jgi:hypothetical protein
MWGVRIIRTLKNKTTKYAAVCGGGEGEVKTQVVERVAVSGLVV